MLKSQHPSNHDNNDLVGVDDFSLDKLKASVSVSPLKAGGSNFKTHVLGNPSEGILTYKPSYGTALFCWLFLSIGLGILFFGGRSFLLNGESLSFSTFFLFGFGLLFALVGALMFYGFYKPIVFDKTEGMFKTGYKNHKLSHSNLSIPFDEIAAVQVIGERVKGEKSNFNSFELNLVLKNGSRKNIIDHGNLSAIVNDANIISDFLEVPIWHAKSKPNQ
jgi:hypothetical protein